MNFNKVIIAGNVTRDLELRTLPSGQPVVNFGVASNRRFTDSSGNKQETVEFHNVVAFGKWADICSRYLTKGMSVLVEGRLQTRSWQGQDGVKRSRTEIIMEFMQMGPKRERGEVKPTPSEEPVSTEEIPVIEQESLEQKPLEQTPSEEKESTDPVLNTGQEEIKVENIPF